MKKDPFADVPRAYLCPISGEPMWQPVINTQGETYDRVSIERWYQEYGTYYQSGEPATNQGLLPNEKLQSEIRAWLKTHRPDVYHELTQRDPKNPSSFFSKPPQAQASATSSVEALDELTEPNVPDLNLDVVLIGDSGVGKTALIRRFLENRYIDSVDPFHILPPAMRTIQGKVIHFSGFWRVHTAQIRQRDSIRNKAYRSASCFILCYDVTDPLSFQNMCHVADDLYRHRHNGAQVVVVGTKSDLSAQKTVDLHDVKAWASEQLGCDVVEVSAKTGENVELILQTIAQKQLKAIGSAEEVEATITLSKHKKDPPDGSSGGCNIM